MREKKEIKTFLSFDVTNCKGSFCLFLFLFSTPLGVFMKLCVSKLPHSVRPFYSFLSFLSSEAIFLFYAFHHIQHRIYVNYQLYSNLSILFLICLICTDLYDLTFASHIDRWFCPLGHPFLVAIGEGKFMVH